MTTQRAQVVLDAAEPTGAGSRGFSKQAESPRLWVSPAALRLAYRVMNPRGTRQLTILIFHRVVPQVDPMFPEYLDAALFGSHLALVKSATNVVPLADGIAALSRGDLPPRALAITFDDGYADNATVALPILKRLGLHATFFVAAAYLDGGRMWSDTVSESLRQAEAGELELPSLGLPRLVLDTPVSRRQAVEAIWARLKYLPPAELADKVQGLRETLGGTLSDDLMLSTPQLRDLHAAGMAIGSHTMTHPILTRLTRREAADELAHSKARLEAITEETVTLLAYPNGRPGLDFDATHTALARHVGYRAAVTSAWGVAEAGADVFQLPRFSPWDRSPLRFGLRLAHNQQRRRYALA